MSGEQVDLEVIAGSDVEFRSETIYFMVLDRFAIGRADKNRDKDDLFDPSHQDWQKYWGGDLQGVLDKLPYLESLKITALWTTPLFDQVHSLSVGDESPTAP